MHPNNIHEKVFLQWGLKPCHNFNWRCSSRPNFPLTHSINKIWNVLLSLIFIWIFLVQLFWHFPKFYMPYNFGFLSKYVGIVMMSNVVSVFRKLNFFTIDIPYQCGISQQIWCNWALCSWAALPCLWPPAHCPAHPPTCLPTARTFINIRGLVIKILTKITDIVTQSWLDINFVIKFD
jgi:hypothetical protein